jgi:hypothetical protein
VGVAWPSGTLSTHWLVGRIGGMRLPQFCKPQPLIYSLAAFLTMVGIVFGTPPLMAQRGASASSAGSGSLVATPSSVTFGNVQVGSNKTLTETLTNAGRQDVTIYNDQVTGTGFMLEGLTLPITLTPGESCTFTLTFSPTASGAASGTSSFGSKEWRKNLAVSLSGTGVTAGQLTISPGTANFGNVTLGQSAPLSATLTASGAAVTISSANSSNVQFLLSGLSLPYTLSAGQTTNFTVTFTPQTAGPVTGTLSFVNNAPGSPIVQMLNGTGVSPQHSVSLTWQPSTSVVAGYNVYRGTLSGGPYTKINSKIDSVTAYVDGSVIGDSTYYYVATAVESDGSESSYSNEVQAVIPAP